MVNLRIDGLGQVPGGNTEKIKQKGPAGFGRIIEENLNKIKTLEKDSDQSITDLLTGKAEIQDTMIALQKVDISMRLLLTIRNKVIEAYREIMRMQY